MSKLEPKCPTCGVLMEEGHVLDRISRGDVYKALEWSRGTPPVTLGATRAGSSEERLPVISYRCPRCGQLLEFAP